MNCLGCEHGSSDLLRTFEASREAAAPPKKRGLLATSLESPVSSSRTSQTSSPVFFRYWTGDRIDQRSRKSMLRWPRRNLFLVWDSQVLDVVLPDTFVHASKNKVAQPLTFRVPVAGVPCNISDADCNRARQALGNQPPVC